MIGPTISKRTICALVVGCLGPMASADYLEECEHIIRQWEQCRGDSCDVLREKIQQSCRCHKLTTNGWIVRLETLNDQKTCLIDINEHPAP